MIKKGHEKADEKHKKTSFYAIFQPGFNSETLKIPPGLVKQGINQQAILRSKCFKEGHCWVVDLYEFGKDKVFFSNGWEKFVQDHDLYEGDFILFKYYGADMIFSVRIFQKNGLEKGFCSNVKTSNNQGEETSSSKRPNNHIVSFDHATPGMIPPRSRRDYAIIEEKIKSFSSPNPFFWRFLKDYNVNTTCTLSIPKLVTNTMLSEETRKVTLKNKEGRYWEVLKIRRSNGQDFFSATGWRSFVVENCLKVGDVCIFEQVGETEFQVHIF